MIDDVTLFQLLDRHAPWRELPLIPSLAAWSAPDELALWQALEAVTSTKRDPPFFAVAWPAAQALAKSLLDGAPGGAVDVRGLTVADVGCGSGLACAAAMKAGATRALALDIDDLAVRAAVELGRRHGVVVDGEVLDALSAPGALLERGVDVVIAGDVVYGEAQRDLFAKALGVWRESRHIAQVIVADSGRPFFDAATLDLAPSDVVLHVDVVTPKSLDGAATRRVTVWRELRAARVVRAAGETPNARG